MQWPDLYANSVTYMEKRITATRSYKTASSQLAKLAAPTRVYASSNLAAYVKPVETYSIEQGFDYNGAFICNDKATVPK